MTAGADALRRYRVLRPLGPTRFGHAQLALLEGEGRSRGFFALELLREEWVKDAELRSCFLEEAGHTLHFEHPNVVRSQEVLAASEVCGRVTRWFAGQSLAKVLERVGCVQFPLHLHVRVLCEVLAAVQYLHELEQAAGGRLVYRDTAPAHVLVTYTGQIKIVGAGFERTIDEIERRSGVLFSDLDYASPELCLGYPAAPGADVYSVGVMLWEALARARRVFADTPEAKVRMRINGEEPDVDQFRRGVPDRLAQICRRALAVSPRDRYPSAQELQIDLESYLADTETDAQRDAGLGALAELMGQHFAGERAEMLSYIEQQLADPELAPPSRAPAGALLAARELAASSTAPRGPGAARLELAADELEELDEDAGAEEGLSELLPTLEPARWDEHTHTVTSFEELGPVEPAPAAQSGAELPGAEQLPGAELPGAEQLLSGHPASALPPAGDAELASARAGSPEAPPEPAPLQRALQHGVTEGAVPDELLPEEHSPHGAAPAASPRPPAAAELAARSQLLQPPVREPDTSGHRAYSSTLWPASPAARGRARALAPVALAAAVVLLAGYGIRIARSSADPAASAQVAPRGEPPGAPANASVSLAEQRLQAAPAAAEVMDVVHPSALAEVGAAAPAEASPAPVPAGELVEIVEVVEQGTAGQGAPAASTVDAVPPEAAALDPGSEPLPEGQPEQQPQGDAEAAPALDEAQLEPPPLIVEELLSGEERRPPPRARRSRARAAAEGRAARSGMPQPRAIDETDPYLE